MVLMFLVSIIYAVRYLRNPKWENDVYSVEFCQHRVLFGVLGILTGMLWANYTWGSPCTESKAKWRRDHLACLFGILCLRASVEKKNNAHAFRAYTTSFASPP